MELPEVDWTRYHLQVLFIDATDTLRARIAAGLFERVAEWNGFGRALYPWSCGVHADSAPWSGLAARAGLMRQAALLGMPPKAFGRAAERFEVQDLDRYDVIVALDSATRSAVLDLADASYRDYYSERVRLLSDYSASPRLLATDTLLATGGTVLLPRRLSAQLGPPQELERLRDVVDAPRPSLAEALSEGGVAEWNLMVRSILLGVAGLVHYLIEAMPDDLPNYDPV